QGAITFDVDVVETGAGWRVAAVLPVAAFAAEDKPSRISAQRDFQPGGASGTASSGRLNLLWFGVPAALVAAALFAIPVFVILRNRRRVRRIEAELAAGR